MKLLLKSIVFLALAVWLAESAPASLDSSSASSNARERRSNANTLEDLLRSLGMVQQQQEKEKEEEEKEETPVDREGDGDDDEGVIMNIVEREMLQKFLNAMSSDAQIMTSFDNNDDNDDDGIASIEWGRFFRKARRFLRRRGSSILRKYIARYG